MRSMLGEIHEDILGGKSFSHSLLRYEAVFGPTFVASVAAGESAGNLAVVLDELARMLRSQIRLRSSLRSMLIYPTVLTAVSLLVVGALVTLILPQFAEIFEQFETPLPWISRFFIAIGQEACSRFWLWGPLVASIVALGLAYLRSDSGRRHWDRFLVSTIGVRRVSQALLIGRACRLIGLMTSSGVPLLDTLKLVRGAVGNSLFSDLFSKLEDEVLNGNSMGKTMLECEFVPAAAARMIATAEQTGNLTEVSILLADHYEEDSEMALKDLISLLEPAITVVMGSIVATVVLSVLLPMLDIATMAQG